MEWSGSGNGRLKKKKPSAGWRGVLIRGDRIVSYRSTFSYSFLPELFFEVVV